MNLYKISQTVNRDYDTYDSAIVCASDEETARNTHPNIELLTSRLTWTNGDWCKPHQVVVELIGSAAPGIPAGVILASFNAG